MPRLERLLDVVPPQAKAAGPRARAFETKLPLPEQAHERAFADHLAPEQGEETAPPPRGERFADNEDPYVPAPDDGACENRSCERKPKEDAPADADGSEDAETDAPISAVNQPADAAPVNIQHDNLQPQTVATLLAQLLANDTTTDLSFDPALQTTPDLLAEAASPQARSALPPVLADQSALPTPQAPGALGAASVFLSSQDSTSGTATDAADKAVGVALSLAEPSPATAKEKTTDSVLLAAAGERRPAPAPEPEKAQPVTARPLPAHLLDFNAQGEAEGPAQSHPGDGSLTSPPSVKTKSSPFDLAALDIKSDAKPDVKTFAAKIPGADTPLPGLKEPAALPQGVPAQAIDAGRTTPADVRLTSSTTAQAAPLHPATVERLPYTIASAFRNNQREFEISLEPKDLGRIDVSMKVDGAGKVTTHLVVERSETLDQLRRDAQQLERTLQQSGLKADSGSLQFSLRDQNQQRDTPGESSARRRSRGTATLEAVSAAPWVASRAARLSAGRGSGLDRRI